MAKQSDGLKKAEALAKALGGLPYDVGYAAARAGFGYLWNSGQVHNSVVASSDRESGEVVFHVTGPRDSKGNPPDKHVEFKVKFAGDGGKREGSKDSKKADKPVAQ